MASVISHPAVPLAIAVAAGRDAVPPRLALVACAASVLPDIDALGYWAGVPYDAPLGHRGFTHSLVFAALLAACGAGLARRLGTSRGIAFGVVLLSGASHGLLDALTTGGMGVAFFSPFSNERYFFPWRVIAVSPIGIGRFFSERGLRILRSELLWIWAPCAAIAAVGIGLRRRLRMGRRS
ncbi:MAG TPA: metal-dependent hydrolase [Thermoanaerobaculia bacterium]